MPTAIVTPDQDAIVSEIEIAAPPERVFQALTDSAEVKQWANSPQLELKIWEMDTRIGGKWRFLCKETSGKTNKYNVDELDHYGEILEIDPPRLLVYTWLTNFHQNRSHKTVVRWELTPTATGTHLKVTHSGLASEPTARQDYAGGWPGLLEAVKNHAEKTSKSNSMPSTLVTPDNDSVVTETHIAAPPERVFQALIDPKQVMQWWTNEICQIETFSMEARRGGRWQYDTKATTMSLGGTSKFHCEGEVTEYDPPRLLAYTWIANWHDDKKRRTVVRWELSPAGSGTNVRVTHSGLAQENNARRDYSGGWPGVVEQLKQFVEG